MSDRTPTTPRGWAVRVLVITCLLGCAAWAFRPLGSSSTQPPPLAGIDRSATQATPPTLTLAAFETPLWVIPPPPPPPPPAPEPPNPEPPPPPFKWQLISITSSVVAGEPAHVAVFYNPDADRLVNARAGDELDKGRTVERVRADTVEIRQQLASGASTVLTVRLRENLASGPTESVRSDRAGEQRVRTNTSSKGSGSGGGTR